jgi:non-heme chloroperoxidase
MSANIFSRALLSALTAATVSTMPVSASAADKHYTVTAPDGVQLAVQEAGNPEGRPVVFIHGLLGSRLNWQAQVNNAQLKGYRLITYDLRGHGLSGKPADSHAYAEGRRWADDLAAVIESAHAEKPVLVGWSLGGAVISNYLAAYGDKRIAGAVYVDGVVELKPDQIVAHPDVYRDMVSSDLATHLDGERTFLALCFHTQPDRITFERLLASAAIASWEMQSSVQSMSVPVIEGLGNAHVPVLLLYGAHDALIDAHAAIARAREINPRIRSTIYAESGHAPFIEEPTRFNDELAAFLRSTSSQ